MVVRGWQTSTLLAGLDPFTAAEIERLRVFCSERFFDLVYYPGMSESEANRFNRLPEPIVHQAVVALLGPERDDFIYSYPFEIAPATDDRPFFQHFFRWRTLPETFATRGAGGLGLLDAGYLILVASLAQALLLGALLVLVPWLVLRRSAAEDGATAAPGRARLLIYFGSLGLGFLFLEVSFLQKFILFLHHPVYSAAVVLAGFLVFAGLGSAASEAWERWLGRPALGVAVAGIVVIGAVDLLLLGELAPWLGARSAIERVLGALLLIAPLAFLMGMPFPIGLTRVRRRSGRLIPWAWAINGYASVIAPIAASLLAVHLGFSIASLLALAAYVVAAVAFRGIGGTA